MKILTILTLFLLTIYTLNAQNFITGKVVDKSTGEPLPYANIYINNSKKGATSDRNGNFTIDFQIESYVEVFTSYIGYTTDVRTVYESNSAGLLIEMSQSNLVFDEKVITSKRDKAWQRNFKKFQNNFFGINGFGKSCEISNPWVLEFKREKGVLIASSNGEILKIKNEALGYEINYLLQEFRFGNSLTSYLGYAGFREIKTDDKDRFKKWVQNRDIAYKGSVRHFIKSVLDDRIAENGYYAYFTKVIGDSGYASIIYDPNGVKNKNFFKKNELDFEGFIKVVYTNELTAGSAQISLLECVTSSKIYPNGEPVDPFSITVRGQMGSELFAHSLPLEYVPLDDTYGTTEFSNQVVKPFTDFHSFLPDEKIHLHTDKYLYFPGETVWLKAYVNIGIEPSELSSKLFTQLTDQNGKSIKILSKIEEGEARGYIILPDSLSNGDYLLSAYTDWSDSSNSQLHFKKKLRIGIPDSKADTLENSSYEIRLFPEGGEFINGLENSFAFEIRRASNELVNEEIEILQNDKVIETYPAIWRGKGRGKVKLNENKSYFARVKSNPESQVAIKDTRESGITLAVEKSEDGFEATIRQKNNTNEIYYYVLISEGRVNFSNGFALEKKHTFKILDSQLADGVNELVIFDLLFRPVKSRLIFRKPRLKESSPQLSISADQFKKRTPITIDIENNELIRSASLSAIDLSQTEDHDDHNIISQYYLKPAIYGSLSGLNELFENDKEEHADLIMMTRGWSRYNWDEIKKFDEFGDGEVIIREGFTISGNVTYTKRKIPVANTNVFLSEDESGLLAAMTDENGNFVFNNVEFSDSSRLVFKIDTKKTKRIYNFTFDETDWIRHKSPIILTNKQKPKEYKSQEENYKIKQKLLEIYDFDGRTYYLKDAVIKADKLRNPLIDESPYSSPFNDKVLLDSINLGATPTTFDVITRSFPGVIARVEQDRSTLQIRAVVKERSPKGGQRNLALYMDNVQIRPNDLMTYNPDIIYSIEYLEGNNAAVLGFEGQNGALLITSRKVIKEKDKYVRTDFIVIKLKGYQQFREFYHPDYSEKQEVYIPDRRSTLYWNPDINVETENMTYYNHDNPAPIKIIMEGFTTDGKPFRQVGYYQVVE
ncbi:MAG: carboxypeptidase-like regulatory domain-containing protein [Bacteroidota bacterium]